MKTILDYLLNVIKSSLFIQIVVFISGMIILFGKQSLLEKFGLDSLSISGIYKTITGLLTLVTCICILVSFSSKVIKQLKSYYFSKKIMIKISELSENEKLLLFQSVIQNRPVVISPINNPIASNLLSRGFLTAGILNPNTAFHQFEIPEHLWQIIKKWKDMIFKEFSNMSEEDILQKTQKLIRTKTT